MGSLKSKYILIGFTVVITILIGIFAIQVFSGTKSSTNISSDKITITEKRGSNPNEVIVTVDTNNNDVLYYSFDGGISFQTENSYAFSENKNIKVILKNSNGNVIGEKEYTVKVIDDKEPPRITMTDFPSIIYVGDSIDLKKYAKAKDSKGNDVAVNCQPATIDTNIEGTYAITYTATDSDKLVSTISVELNVIARPNSNPNNNNNNPEQPSKKQTYYSYRTKSISIYECNYYQCDYIDYNNSLDGEVSFSKDSYCCKGEGCKKDNPRIDVCQLCIATPDIICPFCHEEFTTEYTTKGNICYSKIPLTEGNGLTGGLYKTPKTNCGDGEVKIDGNCHKLDSYGTITCPSEYILKDGKCYKEVKKTCSNQCTNESWSNWSDWSTTKVVASDTTEVRTMEK